MSDPFSIPKNDFLPNQKGSLRVPKASSKLDCKSRPQIGLYLSILQSQRSKPIFINLHLRHYILLHNHYIVEFLISSVTIYTVFLDVFFLHKFEHSPNNKFCLVNTFRNKPLSVHNWNTLSYDTSPQST